MPPRHHDRSEAAKARATVAPLATRWAERQLAQLNPPLTIAQYLALRAVAREEVSGTELARRAGVSGPAVSQLLAGLSDAGLLEREAAADDRRRQRLVLSTIGKRAHSRAESELAKTFSALLGELPPPELDALARALPTVEAALSGAAPPRRPAPSGRPPKPPPPPRPPKRGR
jgi:DNA-binding MarR family transcriptional regulator